MSRRTFLGSVSSAVGGAVLAASKTSSQTGKGPSEMARPNIILLNCHDIGQHLGCYGVETVNTPSIDGLAAEGVRFSNSFCTAPSCSPSRASIFTGRYPHNNGMLGLAHGDFAWDLHPTERHLAGLLRDAGYRTALIGLQHETRRPQEMGWQDLLKGGPCDGVADRAIEWLREAGKANRPFYAQIGFFEPHRKFDYGGATPDGSKGVTIPPWIADEPSAREEFAGYQGAIRKVDAAIGEIVRAADELGLRDNTITIYTADHGMPFPRAKCSLHNPGISVPFIVRWPEGRWTGGTVHSEMISNIDYLPTLLEAVGIDVPANVQGRSLLGLLNGTGYAPRTEVFAEMTYHDYFDPRRCILTATHKLIANFTTAFFFMNPSQTWRPLTVTVDPPEPTYAYHPHIELYDLRNDPLESENLADKPEHAETQKGLMSKLLTWMQDTDDPLLDGPPPSPHHLTTIEKLKSAGG